MNIFKKILFISDYHTPVRQNVRRSVKTPAFYAPQQSATNSILYRPPNVQSSQPTQDVRHVQQNQLPSQTLNRL